MPEFSQQELNYLCRAIFIAIEEAEMAEAEERDVVGFAKIAKMLETSLSERALIVEQHFQNGSSDPSVFANALINMTEEQYEKRGQSLQSFKLLHLKTRFPVQTKYWKNNLFSNIPVDTWIKLVNQKALNINKDE